MTGAALAEPQTTDEAEPRAGLVCPVCECRHFHCIQTRQRPRYVWRRKSCRNCGKVVTTTERIIG